MCTFNSFLNILNFRSQGETEAGANKSVNGSVLNDIIEWLLSPLNSLSQTPKAKIQSLNFPSLISHHIHFEMLVIE